MLQSISLRKSSHDELGDEYHQFTITDQRFTAIRTIYTIKNSHMVIWYALPCAMQEYISRGLALSRDIARLYFVKAYGYSPDSDKFYMDKYFPELHFSDKYLPCIKRELTLMLIKHNYCNYLLP